MLEAYIRQERAKKPILLMTHIVLGYPSFEASIAIVDAMVEAGVELIELQIPFSEPMADGPVILHANQRALEAGATVERCFEVAAQLAARHPQVPFLFMTYFNIVFKRGLAQFAADARRAQIRGTIVPDLPHEEAEEWFGALRAAALEPILLFSPNTSLARMRSIAHHQSGFIYAIARKGVTGAKTDFQSLDPYLARCKSATSLPLALGFGVKDRNDVEGLIGKVDIAVVGSQTIKVIDEEGPDRVKDFVSGLRHNLPPCLMTKPPIFAERSQITPAERDELTAEADLPPVVARMVVEIRSDGSRTVARGALEDLQNGERVALQADAATPMALAAQLSKSLLSIPALARGLTEAAAKELAQKQLLKVKQRLKPLSALSPFSRAKGRPAKKDQKDG